MRRCNQLCRVSFVNLSYDIIEKILSGVNTLTDQMQKNDQHPIALTSANIRLAFKSLVEVNFPKLAVLSYNEVAPEVEIFSIGTLHIKT